MKKLIITLLASLTALFTLSAQTTQEILERMEQEQARFETEGCVWVMEMKIPLLGSFSTTVHSLGDKYRMDFDVKGETATKWTDGITDWDYDGKKNEITISNAKPAEESDAQKNGEMLNKIADGYDVKLKKETADEWHFRCTRSRDNTNKDDPKTMDLIVSKATYLPVSVKTSKSLVTVILRDFAIGVSEQDITFDPAQYPTAKIVDKR